MILKVNSMYETESGFLIPRSHFGKQKGVNFAIVQIYRDYGAHYDTYHTTMTSGELKNALKLARNERLEII